MRKVLITASGPGSDIWKMRMKTVCVTVLFCSWVGVVASEIDLTRQDKQKGAEVVQAAIDRIRDGCIFSQDRLFLRRLAYVESRDGLDPKTYRSGYYGGIWQVDESMFKQTVPCPSAIRDVCNDIQTNIGIDWSRVQWRDLLKPLYSGLAASLYIQLKQGSTIPGSVDAQSRIWKSIYQPQPPIANFSSLVVTESCDAELDVTFLVDSSGSIGSTDFTIMLNFLQRVVEGLGVSRTGTHVAIVRFSSSPTLIFRLNQYYDAGEIVRNIHKIYYSGGGTNTANGINEMMSNVFRESYGMRPHSSKVAILLTDGQSSSTPMTIAAAQQAKDAGVVFFTIGVGSVNPDELKSVATNPNCTHYFLLNDFSEIDTILFEIQRSACRAVISLSKTDTNVEKTLTNKTEGTVSVDITTLQPARNSSANDTFVSVLTTVNCGVVNVYASYEITHPGPAFHDVKGVATVDLPSVMYVNTSIDGRPLYITYEGSKLPASVTGLKNCENASVNMNVYKGPPKAPDVICREDGVEKECTKTDFLLSKYNKFLCRDNWQEIENPCTADRIRNNELYFPHPYDNTKFIRCDFTGDMYITQCPGQKRYIADSHVCGTEHAIINNGKKPIVGNNVPNPCTVDEIRNNHMYFPYPGDLTKYIHCDPTGMPWENSCQDGFLWFQDAQTCSPDYQHQGVGSTPFTFVNPCTKANIDAGNMFFLYPPDSNKYVQCDVTGVYYIRPCPAMMHFSLPKKECVRRDENDAV
ncbi:uncharacterized protein [Haliotis asinina]|uniref:uncharacterized protein n=1 Tax=Haliotis asinina TaxID=109174 RepID=UPI003531DD2E